MLACKHNAKVHGGSDSELKLVLPAEQFTSPLGHLEKVDQHNLPHPQGCCCRSGKKDTAVETDMEDAKALSEVVPWNEADINASRCYSFTWSSGCKI